MGKIISDIEYEELLALREYKRLHEQFLQNVNQVGELVTQLNVFALSINGSVGAKKKTAPAKPVKNTTREERKENNFKRLGFNPNK